MFQGLLVCRQLTSRGFRYLLNSRDDATQKTQLLRAATFTALATAIEASRGGGGCDAVMERAARTLTLHRWNQLEADHEDFERRSAATSSSSSSLSTRLRSFLNRQMFGATATAGRGSQDALFQALVGSSVQLPAELRAYEFHCLNKRRPSVVVFFSRTHRLTTGTWT